MRIFRVIPSVITTADITSVVALQLQHGRAKETMKRVETIEMVQTKETVGTEETVETVTTAETVRQFKQ